MSRRISFLFYGFFSCLEEFFAVLVGAASLVAPFKELFDVFDFQAGGFEAFDHAEGFQFVVVEFSDAGFAFEVGEEAFFVVVA